MPMTAAQPLCQDRPTWPIGCALWKLGDDWGVRL